MNLDGITLHCITNELADILQGGQISKIYQLDARSCTSASLMIQAFTI